MNVDDALEVAKLAAAVGGQLKTIDQFTSERSNNPANKINIQNFINRVKDPRASIPAAEYLIKPPPGFAPPPPEDYIQMTVPDTTIGSSIQQNQHMELTQPLISMPEVKEKVLQTSNNTNIVKHESKNPDPKKTKFSFNENISITRSDIDSIKNSLKGIDKTLQKMLVFIENNK